MHFGGFEDPESQMNSFCNSVHQSSIVSAIPIVKSFGYIASAKKSIHDEIWLKTNIDGRAIRIPVIA